MKKIFIHNAFFRLLVPPVYGILVYLLILLINNTLGQITEIFTGQEVYVSIGMSYLVSESLRLTIMILEKFYPDELSTANRITLQTTVSLGITVVLISVSISAYFQYILDFSITDSQLIIFNSIFGVSSLIYNLLYFSNIYLYKQNVELLNTETILTETLEAELVQFKNEVNPKLLYESLETLITLIYKKEEEAEDFIDHLSAVYRYILSHRKIELSNLEDELKAADHIVHLLNYGHDDNIKFNYKIPSEHLGTPLVPGTIPYLVEYIVRNTIINNFNPLTIDLYIEHEDGYIVLQSKLNDKLILSEEQKPVFQNIQKTYSYYTEKPVVKVKAYDSNYFKIPLMELREEPV